MPLLALLYDANDVANFTQENVVLIHVLCQLVVLLFKGLISQELRRILEKKPKTRSAVEIHYVSFLKILFL